MNDTEMFAFMDIFRNLQRVFPLRGDDHDLSQVGASYFKAFRRLPLKAVHEAAEVWIATGKRFPKPAEWLESVPKRSTSPELHALSLDAATIWHRAEALAYEDAPCHCRLCLEAGMTEKPLRFVPESLPDGRDRQALDGERIVTVGHWAHGDELARYYQAKDAFWNGMLAMFGVDSPTAKDRFQRRIEQRFKHLGVEPHSPKKGSQFARLTVDARQL